MLAQGGTAVGASAGLCAGDCDDLLGGADEEDGTEAALVVTDGERDRGGPVADEVGAVVVAEALPGPTEAGAGVGAGAGSSVLTSSSATAVSMAG